MEIVSIVASNYDFVAQIYQAGLDTRAASFEVKAPSWEKWNANHLEHSRIAILEDEVMLGWAALSPVSSRSVYRGVAEVSIYVDPRILGKGIGTILLNTLIESSEANDLWSLQSSVFPENKSSIALHLKCGFRKIGYREKIGQRDGRWVDNLLFERRSKVIN